MGQEVKNLSKKELEHRILEITVDIFRNKLKLKELQREYDALGREIKQLQDSNNDNGERRNQLTADYLQLSLEEALNGSTKPTP